MRALWLLPLFKRVSTLITQAIVPNVHKLTHHLGVTDPWNERKLEVERIRKEICPFTRCSIISSVNR